MKKSWLFFVLVFPAFFFSGQLPAKETLTLASTTSTLDSGLFEALLPPFEKKFACLVKVIAVGTCQALNGNGTRFLSVRFGNVLGSRGSVVPLFQEQIRRGGPLTLTHPDMRRYFMSIPEAVLLVFQAAHQGHGGEVFVLDMGDPVRVMDLAENLIRLNGLEPGKDIEILATGMRPGEKLFEELLTAEEGVDTTSHNKIYVARFSEPLAVNFPERIVVDCREAGQNPEKIRALFAAHIPTYCKE